MFWAVEEVAQRECFFTLALDLGVLCVSLGGGVGGGVGGVGVLLPESPAVEKAAEFCLYNVAGLFLHIYFNVQGFWGHHSAPCWTRALHRVPGYLQLLQHRGLLQVVVTFPGHAEGLQEELFHLHVGADVHQFLDGLVPGGLQPGLVLVADGSDDLRSIAPLSLVEGVTDMEIGLASDLNLFNSLKLTTL